MPKRELLARAECGFIYFPRAAPDFPGEERNQSPAPHWPEPFLPSQDGFELPHVCTQTRLPLHPQGINGSDVPRAKAARRWSWARRHTSWNAAPEPLPGFLPASCGKDSSTHELFFSRELKAPERLFIESAFECMPQHRYLPFKTEDGPFIKKYDRLS